MAGVRPDAFTATEITSTGYALIATTSAVAVARIGIHFAAPKRITLEDGIVFLAYVSNVAMCSLYISLAPVAARITDVKLGKMKPYPTLKQDGQFISRRYFVAPLLFWLILWSIKFSFLLLYKRLLAGVPKVYTWMWWGIIFVCVGTQAGNFAAYLTACSDMRLFVNGGCKDMTTARQLVSLLYSYSADTLTNVLIMALPIRLTWNLQMPRSKKIGVIALFATCAFCIIVATLRVAQITHNVNKYGQGIDGTWLAIWGMVECSIAVLVGFSPPFAVLVRVTRNKKSSYSPYGYKKQPNSRSEEAHQQGFVMNTISSKSARNKKKGLETTDTLWLDDASSQEGLAPAPKHDGITVTTTVQHEHTV